MEIGYAKKIRTFTKNLLSLTRQDVLYIIKSPRCLLILIILALFMIIVPSFDVHLFEHYSAVKKCSEKYLDSYIQLEASNDVRIIRQDEKQESPLIGNGHIMIQTGDTAEELKIIDSNGSIDVSLDIMFRIGAEKHGVTDTILDYNRGMILRSTCMTVVDTCVHINHRFFVHRSRNVIIQTLRPGIVNLNQQTEYDKRKIEIKQFDKLKILFTKIDGLSKYEAYYKSFKIGTKEKILVIAFESVEKTIRLKREGKPIVQRIVYGSGDNIDDASKVAFDKMDSVIKIPFIRLFEEHELSWKELLHTGIHLDPSDPDPHHIMPSAYLVQSTIYALVSSTVSVNSERQIMAKSTRPESPILAPEYCYNANPTLHSNSLWKSPATISDAVALRDMWKLTLQNHGCSGLVNEGAEGILQAVVLSFAGLQFTSEHLALGTDAEVLHNEIGLSNIRYRNSTVDIFLKKLDKDGLPEIFVKSRQLKKSAENLYACEAGCILHLDQLSETEAKFPIFLTSPPTPILYISHLKDHLKLLQHTLHVRDTLSYQEHYEKHFSNSVAYFWWCFGAAFIVFHIVLIRIVCNEYASWGSAPQQYSYRFRLQP